MNTMMLPLKIFKWHKRKFPLATCESQMLHLLQEICEFAKADNDKDKLEELADIYIIACSFNRWKRTLPLKRFILKNFFEDIFITDNLDKIVLDKIKIVDNREYFWNGEDYDRIR